MLPLKIKAVQAFCTEMNCTPEESSPRSLWKLLLSPGLSVLGQEARGEAQSPAAVVGTSRVLLHCCCSQAEPRLQWARRNNRGSSSGSKDPACRAWWAQQWVVPRYGAELSSPVCSQGTGARGIPRGGCWVPPESSWCCCRVGNPKPSAECRALHPFHSMGNNVQAHVPVWQSSRAQRLLSLGHTCECPAEPGLGGQNIPESQIPLCSAWIPFVRALPRIHWYFCKDFIPDGRCQPVSFACERSVELLLGFGVPCMSFQYWFPPLLCRRCSLALQVLLVSIRKLGYIHNR